MTLIIEIIEMVNKMNMETLEEAYRQLQRDYNETQNALQDIFFEIEDAFTSDPKHSHAEYLNRIARILGVIE